jgi:hypothetical protein
MYEAPPPEPVSSHKTCMVVAVELMALAVPCLWWVFVLYAGVGGNLVTNALGLPNHPFWIKVVSSLAVALAGTLPMLGVFRWLRRRRHGL